MTYILLISVFVLGSIAFIVFLFDGSVIGKRRKEDFLNYFSSVLSDMNVDYRDAKIAPENIANLSASIRNFTEQVERLVPLAKKSNPETQKWFIGIVDEFYQALSLWTERHADEIRLYETSIENENIPTIRLMQKRLEMQAENMRKIIA